MALGPAVYTAVIETTEHGGYPLLEHLRQILDGPFVWAPGVDGAVVLSLRGGDFLFDCGQDLAIGYDSHDARSRVAVPRRVLHVPRRDARRPPSRSDVVLRTRRPNIPHLCDVCAASLDMRHGGLMNG